MKSAFKKNLDQKRLVQDLLYGHRLHQLLKDVYREDFINSDLVLDLIRKIKTPAAFSLQDERRCTPLISVVLYDHDKANKIFDTLVSTGAALDIADDEGNTPLLWATKRNDVRKVRLLAEKGADLDMPDRKGRTALFWAVGGEDLNISKVLLENGASLNVQNNEGETVFDYLKDVSAEKIDSFKRIFIEGPETYERNKITLQKDIKAAKPFLFKKPGMQQ